MAITPACKRLSIICLALFIVAWAVSALSYAKDQVDSAQRLRYLRNTLGDGHSQTPYQARVDAMFNVTADSARTVVASQDAKVRAEAAMQEGLVDALVSTGLTDQDFQNQILQRVGEETEDEEKTKDGILNNRVQGAEKDFLIGQEQLFRDEDKRRADLLQLAEKPEEEIEDTETSDKLEPSLTQNPFYQQPVKDFQANKYVIANRLMEAGMDFDDAQNLVNSATSPEELMMDLMDDEGYTYGQAKSFLFFE